MWDSQRKATLLSRVVEWTLQENERKGMRTAGGDEFQVEEVGLCMACLWESREAPKVSGSRAKGVKDRVRRQVTQGLTDC
jgi:hypothetical protein